MGGKTRAWKKRREEKCDQYVKIMKKIIKNVKKKDIHNVAKCHQLIILAPCFSSVGFTSVPTKIGKSDLSP